MTTRPNDYLKPLAKKLRKNGTRGEALIWRDVLKCRRYWPYQFNRQYPIGNYIVDFIARKLALIIEIDGSSHIAKCQEDYDRQRFLENLGFTVLRFSESEIVWRMDEVIVKIGYAITCIEEKKVQDNPPPPSAAPPFPKGDEL